jgi:mRNA interferase RelE/StbE
MQIIIDKKAVKEINKLDFVTANRIYDYLEEIENIDPRTKGKTLKGKLKHLWRYRVGDYWILVKIQDEELIVLVVRVSHRSNVY